jgi:hypothetical protein
MKQGNFTDLLELATKDESLAKELRDLAARHGIELTDEVSDKDLDNVSGGSRKGADGLAITGI